MSLYGRLAEIDKPVFRNDQRWGTKATFIPKGDWSNRIENLDVVVFEDSPAGTNENEGDGVTLNRQNSRRIRESIVIYVSRDIDLQQDLRTYV